MPKLKLFISHSSRLDDMDHEQADADRNWRLLHETCAELERRYRDAIEILVDWQGLTPGDDWNRELNLWLAECQAAIILFSKRALTLSDWVAKEAAILGWRRVLDPGFELIPVTIEGESSPEDLAGGFWGSLDLNRIQSIHAASRAVDIVDELATRLGDPQQLVERCASTPLQRLQAGVAQLLAEAAIEASLEEATLALGGAAVDARVSNRTRFAEALARRLFRTSLDAPGACFEACRTAFDYLAPRLLLERAWELVSQVRALWVHPAAAAYLPAALEDRSSLALCGRLIAHADDLLGADAYTLERYLQRAWPGAQPRCVPVTEVRSASDVKAEIRRRVLGGGLPPFLTEAELDEQVNREPTATAWPRSPRSWRPFASVPKRSGSGRPELLSSSMPCAPARDSRFR